MLDEAFGTAAITTFRPTTHRRAAERLTAVAQAADGPAPTLVVDLRQGADSRSRDNLIQELALYRTKEMARDPRLGAKTIGVTSVTASEVDLIFLQGLGSVVDPLSEVCLNSAAAAVEVACVEWALLTPGNVTVHMGDFTVELELVA